MSVQDKNSERTKKPAKPDDLTRNDKGKTELTEDELKDVSGGPIYMDPKTNLKL